LIRDVSHCLNGAIRIRSSRALFVDESIS